MRLVNSVWESTQQSEYRPGCSGQTAALETWLSQLRASQALRGLSFLVCKMGLIVVPISEDSYEI